ncbi:MAG: hypothetical protein ACYTXA_24490 [Nostoc sp.]
MGWVTREPWATGGQDFGVSVTSLREAPPTTTLLRPFDRLRAGKLSTSQYKSVERCPPHKIG